VIGSFGMYVVAVNVFDVTAVDYIPVNSTLWFRR